VICYEFLWSHEVAAGLDRGVKKRPAIISSVEKRDRATYVTVVPITHLKPDDGKPAIELPPRVKAHLGLDQEKSWIICDELNEFAWPGDDIYPIPGGAMSAYDYGEIPPALFEKIREIILSLDLRKKKTILR
jgi:hypothetical protein